MARATQTVAKITAADLLANLSEPQGRSKTERTVNWLSIKTAKVAGTIGSATDNFGAHYDLAKKEAKSAANIALAAEAARVAAVINENNAKLEALLTA